MEYTGKVSCCCHAKGLILCDVQNRILTFQNVNDVTMQRSFPSLTGTYIISGFVTSWPSFSGLLLGST